MMKSLLSAVVAALLLLHQTDGGSIRSENRRRLADSYILNDTFIVTVDSSSEVSIEVKHVSSDTPIWNTIPGTIFLRAAKGDATIKEARGHFEVDDQISDETTFVSITQVNQQQDDSLEIEGEMLREERKWYRAWRRQVTVSLQFKLTFNTVSQSQLGFSIVVQNPDGSENTEHNRIFLQYATTSEEAFFGFGEQFSHLNLKGKEVTIIASENGIGRNEQGWLDFWMDIFFNGISGQFDSTYAPMPYYLTNLNRSVFLENYEIAMFDLTESDSVTIKLHSSNMRGRILHGESPLDLIQSFSEYTGRMDVLPDWMNNGAIVGMQGGTERVQTVLSQLQALDTPIGAFWLQDWVGQRKTIVGSQLWWNWYLDEERYPDWYDMVDTLQQDGIRVMTYINPFLANVAEADEYTNPSLYQEAEAAGYLVLNENNEPYPIENTDFSASLVDLTNPDAREWLKDVIKQNVLGVGASGWMADFGEALPFDAVLSSGISPDVYHNQYPEEWAKLNKEAIEEAGRTGDVVFFSRSGFTKSPGLTTLLWEGDQMVTWDDNDGLQSAITGLLSSGLSGFSLNHNDIGGYTSVVIPPFFDITRSQELFLRWTEMNAFTAVFRTHEGITPDDNVQFYTNDETLQQFAKFSKVYAALAFYRKTLMQEAAQKGWPVVRHLFLHYPNDPISYELEYQWLLGSELLVAPVTEEGQLVVQVYLPKGDWVHVWTSTVYSSQEEGQWVEVDAPIGEPAVFFKKDSTVGTTFVANLQNANVL